VTRQTTVPDSRAALAKGATGGLQRPAVHAAFSDAQSVFSSWPCDDGSPEFV